MFCPEGWVSLASLELRLSKDLSERLASDVVQPYRENGDLSPGGFFKFLSKISPLDFQEIRIFQSIYRKAYICSPSGQLLKFDLQAVENATDFWEFSMADLRIAEKNYPGVATTPSQFRHMFRLFDYDLDELNKDFQKYSSQGRPLFEFMEDLNLLWAHQTVPMYYERVGYTITLQAYDYLRKFEYVGMEEFDDIARILRPFEGWALCVPESYVREEWMNNLQELLRDETSKPSGRGRPAKMRIDTLEAYQRLYPRGHGNETWPQILRKVNKATGHNVSVDTLKRAVLLTPAQNSEKIEA